MPVLTNYPGVYIEEIPSGVHTITGVATSITAFLGRTLFGPMNEPTTINSFGDFERQFGGLEIDTPLTYAVKDFYLNGGSQALIIRLYNGDPVAGTATLNVGGLNLTASSPGAWGHDLYANLDYNGITDDVAKGYGLTAADLFNLTITYKPANKPPIIERIPNVSFQPTSGGRRVDRLLSDVSQLVRLGLKADGTPDLPNARPTEVPDPKNPVRAANGKDSAALDDATYQGDEASKTGIFALERTDLFNLLCIPPDAREGAGRSTSIAVYQAAAEFCALHRAMLIIDSPAEWGDNPVTAAATAVAFITNPGFGLTQEQARNAALYFPRVIESDSLRGGQLDTFAPCGIIAGVMATTDRNRGVWKAPAGLEAVLGGIQALQVNLNDAENGSLNPIAVNCLRSFPVTGRVVWGARTMRGADQLADDYKYIPVRRLTLYIEESLYRGTQWVVFEPNDEPLWAQIRLNVGAFMHDLFVKGAFQGTSPKDAYFVKCDKETTTQNDINQGIVNIIVAFAPLKPAEFVVIQIQQITGQIQV